MSKIAMCTLLAYKTVPEFMEVFDRHRRSYCEKYGIAYKRVNEVVYKDKHPVWSKMPIMCDLLNEDYDWVIWMDADAFPANKEKSVEEYLNTVKTSLVMRKDRCGWNNGVFAVHNDEERCRFLSWSDSDEAYQAFRGKLLKEQEAMAHYINNKNPAIVTIPPDSFGWNQYPEEIYRKVINNYHEGDWCVHFPNYRGDGIKDFCSKHGLW